MVGASPCTRLRSWRLDISIHERSHGIELEKISRGADLCRQLRRLRPFHVLSPHAPLRRAWGALHIKSNEEVRGAVSEPEAVATGSALVKKRLEFSHKSSLFLWQRRPGRYRFRF